MILFTKHDFIYKCCMLGMWFLKTRLLLPLMSLRANSFLMLRNLVVHVFHSCRRLFALDQIQLYAYCTVVAGEVTKNIYFTKGDDRRLIRWLKKFRSGSKNLDDQAMPNRPNTMDSEAKLVNPACSTRRVSGEHDISQCGVVRHLHDLSKNIQKCWIVCLKWPKYGKTFDSPE